jgi:hypothetical protein
VIHVEDGGWVNADGDFGSPQFINWNWPLVSATGQFDIPNGWAEDERNWAVLTAATNHVVTAEQVAGGAGAVNVSRIVDPTLGGTTNVEKAWHFLLVGHESGYMYYGTSLDFEIKPTLAANRAVEHADLVLAAAGLPGAGVGADQTPPTVWLPQRLPWNPGGYGGGSLWGYPGGQGKAMSRDFHVWTFAHDVSGVQSVTLKYRFDLDGGNPLASTQNETYAGGTEVSAWQSLPMTRRTFPKGNVYNNPDINFTVLPTVIADEYFAQVTGLADTLVDYYVEAADSLGNVTRSPIQHVYVGTGSGGGDGGGGAVTWEPQAPVAGGTLTVRYDAVAGALPDNTNPVRIHVGHSGWTNVLNPDPAMTFDAATQRWTYTYAIPGNATAVDFVFNNGAGTWDNNGGADWHVPVTGAVPPPYTIDGAVDAGLVARAACGGQSLFAEYDGRWLYLAAPGVSTTGTLDHFVFLARSTTTGTVAAPWSKAGTVPAYDLLLGNENDNNWCGWFDATGAGRTSGLTAASGAWLEARVDVSAWWNPAPTTLRVGFAAYGNANGAALAAQVPCGNADGNVDAVEWYDVSANLVAADGRGAGAGGTGALAVPRITFLSGNPTRGAMWARVEWPAGARRGRIELVDLRGRAVRTLYEGEVAGVTGAAPAAGLAPGLYFVRASSDAGTSSARVVVLP